MWGPSPLADSSPSLESSLEPAHSKAASNSIALRHSFYENFFFLRLIKNKIETVGSLNYFM